MTVVDTLSGVSASTVRAYAKDFDDLEMWCRERGFASTVSLNARDVFAYLVDVHKRGRSLSTVRRRATMLRRIAGTPLLELAASELTRLEHRILRSAPGQASVLVISDDAIIRAGLGTVLTESGAICWADSTDNFNPATALVWDYILVWLNSRRRLDRFGAIPRIGALDSRTTTQVPVIAVHSGDVNALVRLRLAEAGARYLIPHPWLSEHVASLAGLLAAAEVPIGFHLDTPLALRQRLGLRLSGELAPLLDAAALLPDVLWTGYLPQSHLPIPRTEISRIRSIASDQAGIPSPDFSKYAASLRRPPATPEWPRVREVVRAGLGIDP
jgi:CheY-like chemotaxis protein